LRRCGPLAARTSDKQHAHAPANKGPAVRAAPMPQSAPKTVALGEGPARVWPPSLGARFVPSGEGRLASSSGRLTADASSAPERRLEYERELVLDLL